MSILLEKTAEPQIQSRILAHNLEATTQRIESIVSTTFHRRMAYAFLIVLILSFVGCKLTSIHVDLRGYAIAVLAASAMIAPLPIYWHEKRRTELRESTLVIPWELLFVVILPIPALIAARLATPLEDSLFGHIDRMLGFNGPAIMALAQRRWLGGVISSSYPLLQPLMVVSALAPSLLGKMKNAREFLLANLAAFAIGLPLFALLPAVGPWYYYHLAPNSAQVNCWTQFQLLRSPAPYVFLSQGEGVVCFPSFHVIWAILCAAALWGFRPIRIPVALFSAMIIASTLTTGWHYFIDVVGGIAVAVLSMAIARVYSA
jgi:hypothetical protein